MIGWVVGVLTAICLVLAVVMSWTVSRWRRLQKQMRFVLVNKLIDFSTFNIAMGNYSKNMMDWFYMKSGSVRETSKEFQRCGPKEIVKLLA